MPTFGRPVHLRGSPHRLRPGTSPHALRIPPHGGHPALRRFTPPADDALPPSLDMTPLIRAPEGLQPSRTTRCSAHTMPYADFCSAVRPPLSRLSRRSDTEQISWGKLSHFPCTIVESTLRTLMDYGLRGTLPSRPMRAPCIRFLSIDSHVCLMLPSDPASRR